MYDAGGEFLEAWPHPNGGGFHTYDRMWVDTGGVVYVTTLLNWGVPPWEWELALIGVSAEGEVTDTIPEPALAFEPSYLTASRENSASRRQVPFTGEKIWTFSPEGYMVGAITSRYAVYLFRPAAPVLRIERAIAPVAVQAEEAEERRSQITAGLQRQYGSWRWNGPDVPDEKPPIRALSTAADGSVWVVVSRPGRPIMSSEEAAAEAERTGRPVLRFREPPAFDVFDPSGRYLGPVAAPEALTIESPAPLVRGDTVWGVERDALGVPAVVRYRLDRDG